MNLQRGHLMVNYDLPWNPNKIEQRFGRIHRIGQTEVCHLWNLVAAGTREGEVYARLLESWRAARERWAAVSMTCSASCSTAWRSGLAVRGDPVWREGGGQGRSSSRSMALSTRQTCSNCCVAAPDQRHHAGGEGRGTAARNGAVPRRCAYSRTIQSFFVEAFPASGRPDQAPRGRALGNHPCPGAYPRAGSPDRDRRADPDAVASGSASRRTRSEPAAGRRLVCPWPSAARSGDQPDPRAV